MKFVEFEDSDTGEIISVKAERVDAVYNAAQSGNAILRIAESIVKVKGTRADVVAKLEAASGPEIHGTVEGFASGVLAVNGMELDSFVDAGGTLPTEPGLYEYRWPTLGIVTPLPPRPSSWILVKVVQVLGALFVEDPTTENDPPLSTYSNAEWRKRDVPE